MKYAYYPGCSLEKNAAAYHNSTLAISAPLGLELEEIEDWNCCGATEYFAINRLAAYSLVARNLALAEKQCGKLDLVAPCSACFLNLSKVDAQLQEDPSLADKVNRSLAEANLHYKSGSVKPRHLLQVIMDDIGLDAIKAQVTKPLQGLRIAPYYGCMIVRPGYLGKVDNTEYPMSLDRMMSAIGATVVDFPLKSACCGGHMTQLNQDIALDMIRILLQNAVDNQADVIVTTCPMCQLNLDAYQGDVNRHFKTKFNLPVLYFTQLLGLAYGMDAKTLGIGKELVDARQVLTKIGVEVPPEEPPKAKRPPKEALPMPKMPEEAQP
jgi:heterodisulfide reductase subunit B